MNGNILNLFDSWATEYGGHFGVGIRTHAQNIVALPACLTDLLIKAKLSYTIAAFRLSGAKLCRNMKSCNGQLWQFVEEVI